MAMIFRVALAAHCEGPATSASMHWFQNGNCCYYSPIGVTFAGLAFAAWLPGEFPTTIEFSLAALVSSLQPALLLHPVGRGTMNPNAEHGNWAVC